MHDDIYEVDGYTVIHLGRSVPQSGDAVQRGERVAIVLDPVITTSYREIGGLHGLPLAPGFCMPVCSCV